MSDIVFSDIAFEVSGATARTKHNPILAAVLRWISGVALRVVMVLVVIALIRSPPSALH